MLLLKKEREKFPHNSVIIKLQTIFPPPLLAHRYHLRFPGDWTARKTANKTGVLDGHPNNDILILNIFNLQVFAVFIISLSSEKLEKEVLKVGGGPARDKNIQNTENTLVLVRKFILPLKHSRYLMF